MFPYYNSRHKKKEYALKVSRTLCEVHEFGDAEIIWKNRNRFPNCSGDFPAGVRIVFMTRNYWLRISKSAWNRVANNKMSVKRSVCKANGHVTGGAYTHVN
jgi:hypothetical protein